MAFVDTHVHFHFPDYDEDREQAIQRARDAGIQFFLNVGTDPASSRQSLELAKKYDFFYASAGIHPHDAQEATEAAMLEIAEILKEPRVVAVGEVGLDFFRDHSPREKQKEVFGKFLELHRVIGKPLVIHCRDAYQDLLEMVKGKAKSAVMHCFSSDAPVMKQFLDLGFYISFAGPLSYKKNDVLREACKICPLDRLLLETDAPFLPPQTMRGKRNESAYLLETASVAAELHGISLAKLGEITTANAQRLFKL